MQLKATLREKHSIVLQQNSTSTLYFGVLVQPIEGSIIYSYHSPTL